MVQRLDRTGCRGNTIKVAAGHYVDLAAPTPESIDIQTIAAALSKLCRFGCHCPRFYSVAEHSILAAMLADKDGFTGDPLRAVFLHDAAEAYIGDVVKPLKVLLSDNYAEIEHRMERAVSERFSVDLAAHEDVIKPFDRMMLKAEKIALWPEDSEEWEGFADIDECDVAFRFWSPENAEQHFLNYAGWLGLN